jgi:predicted DNA-binding WGR domain protein
MDAVHLRRVDATRNMRRFYRIEIETDLFGGALLVKQWGRIGKCGRIVAKRYADAALAAEALQKQIDLKRRRGYAVVD